MFTLVSSQIGVHSLFFSLKKKMKEEKKYNLTNTAIISNSPGQQSGTSCMAESFIPLIQSKALEEANVLGPGYHVTSRRTRVMEISLAWSVAKK